MDGTRPSAQGRVRGARPLGLNPGAPVVPMGTHAPPRGWGFRAAFLHFFGGGEARFGRGVETWFGRGIETWFGWGAEAWFGWGTEAWFGRFF